MSQKCSKADLFKELTWDDLDRWGGPTVVSRGESYQRGRRVQGLAPTSHGELVAWVQGGLRYSTRVDIEDGELTSACTCPYWDTCKHAVAVVLEYLDQLKQGRNAPTVTDEDQRLHCSGRSRRHSATRTGRRKMPTPPL